ncbi:MAG: FAD-dependent oxidoreductase [Thermotogaceae bacterium]|nr:FAD-dependent oxidoreductase [Thermotogaceae bacterium]RKX39959.1 MAG: hypothetical protein DRP33_07470 [Thermotogota bacterium]
MRPYMEYTKEVRVIDNPDLLVVGGGIAGFSAAVAAKRAGVDVMLIEQYSVLGGLAAVGGVGAFCGETKGQGEVFDEIVWKLERLDAISPYEPYEKREARPFDHEVLKLVLQDMAVKEGIKLLVHTRMVDVVTENQKIEAVLVHNVSGVQAIKPRVVIDCTGDGVVARYGGFPCVSGDPLFHKALPMSLIFFMRDVRRERPNSLPEDITKYSPENVPMVSLWPEPDGKVGVKFKVIGFDPTDGLSLSRAEVFARSQIFSIVGYLQEFAHRTGLSEDKISVKTYKYDYASMQIGIRESWRIIGEYVLVVDDLRIGRKFDDGIAVGRFYLDALDPNTDKREHIVSSEALEVPPYHIPYRSLIPKDAKNLLVAGRCLSADQLALSSARVMTTASMMGQAAGKAAALIIENHLDSPLDVDVTELRKILIEHGAILE